MTSGNTGVTRKEFLYGAAATAALSGLKDGASTRPRRRPNVLLVMADEWRAQAFNHMGDVNARTVSLDRFHGEAISFPNAIAGTPTCCPSRASLITGQFPLTHGVYINDIPLRPNTTTLGEAFANQGYKTGYIGKWHLYGSPEGRWERRLSYIPRESRFGFKYWKACECTHDYNHSLYYDGDDPTPRYWPGYDAIAQTQDAISFIHDHARAADPYFLILSWGPPHFPYLAPEAYSRIYAEREITLRPNVPEADREQAVAELRGYYAAIAVLDDCFAQLLVAIEQNEPDDTIMIFTSDHGEMAYSQGLEHKLYPWEESIRVPFMLRYPRAFGRRPRVSNAMLNSSDVMPTLLGLAGIDIPSGIQGFDFSSSLLDRPSATAPQTALVTLPVPITSARSHGIDAYRGVRDARYTYVRSLEEPWLLYDNLGDPYQMANLIDQPAAAPVRERMERELSAWLRRLQDDFLPPQDYLKRDRLEHFIEARWPVGEEDSPWGDWRARMSPPPEQLRSIDSSFRELLQDPDAAAVLTGAAPGLAESLHPTEVDTLSPRILSILSPSRMSPARLTRLEAELARLRESAKSRN